MSKSKKEFKKGLTLVEVLVGATIFTIIAISVYGGYSKILQGVALLKVKVASIDLLNEQIELVRNMQYSNVGVVGGIPNGLIPYEQNINRDGIDFVVKTTVRNIDNSFDGTINTVPKDTSPADYKFVNIRVECDTCRNFTAPEYSTFVAPKNLETASNNGALFVRVMDANGLPVSGATVNIVNKQVIPNIVINDQTDNQGYLQIVDVPPGNEAYEITVSKAGYSTEKTYATVSGLIPEKPNATVLLQQVTQISFSIDRVGELNIASVNTSCQPVSNVDFNVKGTKSTTTNVTSFKYNKNLSTNSEGNLNLPNLEWDNYSFTVTDGDYDLLGSNPLSPVQLNPGATQDLTMVVANKNPNRLIATIIDTATNLPITGAEVTLSNAGGFSATKVTGKGYLSQTDWSGGAGQEDFSDSNKYFSSDGNVENLAPSGEVKLKKILDNYITPATLESSTFDTGSNSNFHELLWLPENQNVHTGIDSVKFQIATNATNTSTTTWNFKGPDNTPATFFTINNKLINDASDGTRYFRYKAFLSTESATNTPSISDVSVTFTSSCTPAGQVSFSGLSTGDYVLNVRKSGYQDIIDLPISITKAWEEKKVLISQ